jgi:hypothetical protein
VELASLFLEQVVTGEQEGGEWLASSKHRDGMTELRVQTAKSIDHHGTIRHRVPDVTKEIDKVFETAKVVMDGEVTLEEAMEFLKGVDGALIGVVEE